MSDYENRLKVVKAIRKVVEEFGWQIRENDEFIIVITAPLARSWPRRNRWPDEPEEHDEPSQEERERERDGNGS